MASFTSDGRFDALTVAVDAYRLAGREAAALNRKTDDRSAILGDWKMKEWEIDATRNVKEFYIGLFHEEKCGESPHAARKILATLIPWMTEI
jgi:hypothetical protein